MSPHPEVIDALVERSLRRLAADPHVCTWRAKERNWVNYYAHRHLLLECRPDGPLSDPAQIGIEVGVAQPHGYSKPAASRDLVIWESAGATCWGDGWEPCTHPLVIIEWKVQRPGYANRNVNRERAWLRAYCAWQPSVAGYAVEVDTRRSTATLTCARFRGPDETPDWLRLAVG